MTMGEKWLYEFQTILCIILLITNLWGLRGRGRGGNHSVTAHMLSHILVTHIPLAKNNAILLQQKPFSSEMYS